MTYVDPNVPCGQPRVAKWIFIGYVPEGQPPQTPPEFKIYGWIPKKVVEGAARSCP